MGTRGWIKTPEQIKQLAEESPDISNKGTYRNLMTQLNKTARHSKSIAITSQRQYYNHMDQFCRFVANNYNLKSLHNIKDKHIVAYVQERQLEGKSASSVKQDLAAIRYFHDQMPNTRHYLSDNHTLAEKHADFSLEQRQFGGVDRRPTELEYQSLVSLATKSNQLSTASIIQLAREQGLRIHEATRLNRVDAEKALRTGELTVKGKGGLVRSIPLRDSTKPILQEAASRVPRGEKLFVAPGERTHTVIQRCKDFIRNHRDKVYDTANNRSPDVKITMHSFRHAYAKEEYNRFIKQGLSDKDAKLATSKLIGHSREDVTRIYLGE